MSLSLGDFPWPPSLPSLIILHQGPEQVSPARAPGGNYICVCAFNLGLLFSAEQEGDPARFSLEFLASPASWGTSLCLSRGCDAAWF